jgi:hypothetical protein
MPWDNSRAPTTHRARATELTPTSWLIEFGGKDYTISFVRQRWAIRNADGVIHTMPQSDLGKETPIAWIEENC